MEKLSNILKEGAQYIGMTAFITGAYTAAGAIVGGPMGASGGALFGFTATVLNKPILWAARGLLKPEGMGENIIVTYLAGAISLVASAIFTYGIFKAVGIPLKKLFLLNLTAGAIIVAAALVAFAVASVAIIIIGVVNPELNRKMWNSMVGNHLGQRHYG